MAQLCRVFLFSYLYLFSVWMVPIGAFKDPKTAVTCSGPLPPFDFDEPDLEPGTTLKLQHICANADQGGVPGKTTEGFCAPRTVHTIVDNASYPSGVHVVDDDLEYRVAPFAIDPSGPWLRLSHYCMLRCTCRSDVNYYQNSFPHYSLHLTLELDYCYSPDYPPTWIRSEPAVSYRINLDDASDRQLEESASRAPNRWLEISAYEDTTQDLHADNLPDSRTARVKRLSIRLKEDHQILCNAPIPDFRLPRDQDPVVYRHLDQLCSVPLDEGEVQISAGAYCRPYSATEGDIDFADEMTPHPEWTWDAEFLPDSTGPTDAVRLRNYCWNHCSCVNRYKPRRRVLGPVWQFLSRDIQPWMIEALIPKPAEAPDLPKVDPERPATVGCFAQLSCVIGSLFNRQPQCDRSSAPPDAQYLCQLDAEGRPTVQPPPSNELSCRRY